MIPSGGASPITSPCSSSNLSVPKSRRSNSSKLINFRVPMGPMIPQPPLLVAQRHRRVDARRAHRRNPAGDRPHRQQRRRHQRKSQHVPRILEEQHAPHAARRPQRSPFARRHADRHQPQPFPQNHPPYVAHRRAQRQPHADLARPPAPPPPPPPPLPPPPRRPPPAAALPTESSPVRRPPSRPATAARRSPASFAAPNTKSRRRSRWSSAIAPALQTSPRGPPTTVAPTAVRGSTSASSPSVAAGCRPTTAPGAAPRSSPLPDLPPSAHTAPPSESSIAPAKDKPSAAAVRRWPGNSPSSRSRSLPPAAPPRRS